MVRHEIPSGIEIEAVSSFEEAERALRDGAPDAAVVSLPPAHLPWRAFQHLCASREPPVPVLYESCVFGCACDAGLEPGDGYVEFLPKPAPRTELRAALTRLLAEVDRSRSPEPVIRA